MDSKATEGEVWAAWSRAAAVESVPYTARRKTALTCRTRLSAEGRREEARAQRGGELGRLAGLRPVRGGEGKAKWVAGPVGRACRPGQNPKERREILFYFLFKFSNPILNANSNQFEI